MQILMMTNHKRECEQLFRKTPRIISGRGVMADLRSVLGQGFKWL